MEQQRQIEKVRFVVRALIQNELGEVLILQRPDGSWCLPGGKIDPHEDDPTLVLKREVWEELGLVVVNQNLFSTSESTVSTTLWHNGYFLTQVEQSDNITLNYAESLQYKWIRPELLNDFSFSFENDKVIQSFFKYIEA